MDEKPKRRWFRFRLSTVLILTAILAWGMATRPHIVPGPGAHIIWTPPETKAERDSIWTRWGTPYANRKLNPALRWPAIALAVFLSWKAAWAVVERRRREARPE
ncbi:MAG: hypothetical protein K2Y37_06125 [Pirellulales bacterium]|nr:hypothetical protein [Pirellulales bacterium]